MEIYSVKINGLTNPTGFDFPKVVCMWKVRDSKGKSMKSAAIEVSLSPSFDEIVWKKSGLLECTGEVIEIELQPRTRYYFRISVASDIGEEAVSDVSFFETAKINEPWAAKWIGVEDGDTHPEFAKHFCADGKVESARLYITGLGIFEASINGKKVGNDILAPFINDYDEHFQYCTYDVTNQIEHENEISVLLGDGWYRGHFGLGGPTHYERPYALLAELRIHYIDGRQQTIATDSTWQYRKSFTTLSDIYNGETQDYFNWKKEPWKNARLIAQKFRLCQRYSSPLHYMETLPVKNVIHTPKGETVLDFGQNFAGHVVVTQLVPAGCTMTLEFGEIMQEGNFYHDNYRSAKSVFTYVSDGVPREIAPRFTFFGFRYVKVSGIEKINPNLFTGRAIYSEMEQTGFISTGNKKINQLISNSLWGLKSNFIDMPTDCPQRDERLGWCGDAQVFCRTAALHMDTRAFYQKFERDLRSDQVRNNGAVAIYLPNAFPGLSVGIWSDIAAFLPKAMYDIYGDKNALEKNFPLMKDWVDYISSKDIARGEKNLYDFGFQFGDWLALDGSTATSRFGRTDTGFVCSCYYYASTKYVAEAEKTLGYSDAEKYFAKAEKIRAAILNEYFSPSGRLACDTQTGYLLAMKFGIYIDKEKILRGFENRLKKDLNRLTGGFVGATIMCCALAENGMTSTSYDMLFNEEYPGWLYCVNLGATTIWERWNSVLPDGKLSGTTMNSLNHYSYGSVVEFLYSYAAGIQPLEPGFRKAKIAPNPDIRLGKLNCSIDSACGKYVSNWEILPDGKVSFHVEIPFGCSADLCLPETPVRTLTAGDYDFLVACEKDFRKIYSESTPFEILLKDSSATEILKKYGLYAGIDTSDRESMSKSLLDSKKEALVFRLSTEAQDRAIAEIKELIWENTEE